MPSRTTVCPWERDRQAGMHRGKNEGEEQPIIKGLLKAFRKEVETLGDSGTAALAAIDYERSFLGEDVKANEHNEEAFVNRPHHRPHVVAFINARASTSGVHETPFLSLQDDRNGRQSSRRRVTTNRRNHWEGLPSQDDDYRVIVDALHHRRVCVFHADCADCPNKSSVGGGCFLFSHDEEVVPHRRYHRTTPTQALRLEPIILTALEIRSAYIN